MKINLLYALSLLLVTQAFAAEPELKGTPSELSQYLANLPRTVTIIGEAEVRVPADQALVSLKVTAESKSLQEALHNNQDTRSKVVAYLKSKGLPAERVHASRFSSTPKYGWLSDKAKSYRVDNIVRITVQDESEFQAVAGAVDNWSNVQFQGVEFQHRDKEASKAKALAESCENANQRKTLLEQKLGVTLQARRFSGQKVLQNAGANDIRKRYGSYAADAELASGVRNKAPMEVTNFPQADEDVSSFGELVFTAEVSVEYAVETK